MHTRAEALMGRKDHGTTVHPQRDQTDESLRVERQKADAGVAARRDSDEGDADEVVRVARQRADEVVQSARDDADHERGPGSPAGAAISSRERGRADVVLERERAHDRLAPPLLEP